MTWRVVVAAGVAVLAVAAGASPAAGATNATPDLVAAYPNPAAPDDAGEFVVARIPDGTDLGALSVSDGDGAARPADSDAAGLLALSTDPERTRALTDYRVVELRGDIALANGGDRVVLRHAGRRVGGIAYDRAPEGELYRDGTWRPLGATDMSVAAVRGVEVTAFALPDSPTVPAEVLASADRRLLLGAYTFRSERAAGLLADAADRGVEVRLLVEGGPVGGIDRRQARLLDGLVARGVEVRVVDGPLARYRFHHPKYAVADDRLLVTSENWAAGGTGGRATRGWGTVVESAALADRLAAVFRADAGWHDAVPWREFRSETAVQPASPPANDSYPSRFPAHTGVAESVRLVVAPDNARRAVAELMGAADERLLVAQPRVDPGHAFVRAAVDAARRGVSVRLLLGSAWYEREQNRDTARRLRRTARQENLDLAVRLVEPRSRFDRLHLKGVVVDGEAAVVGSINWNEVSVGENREVAVILRGPAAGHYARVFRADWRGGAWRLPVGVAVVVTAAALGVVVALWRTIRFGGASQYPERLPAHE